MGLLDYPAFLTDLHQAELTHQKQTTPHKSQFHHSKTTKLLLFLIVHQIYDVLLITKVSGADSAAKQHIDQGNKLLAAGSLSDALTHYNEAVDADPDNYQARYRRATCLLALGRSKAAIPDLDKTIQVKPEFWQARQQRANILLKQGLFEEAAKDYEACSIHSAEARDQLASLKTTKQHFENAKVYASRGYHDRALKSLDKIKEITPWFSQMRELRANCFELFGETQQAINELKPMIQLSKHSAPETYLRLAKLYYIMPDVPQSLDQIRECLKIDPDHKTCFAFYKVAKKLNKQMESAKKKLQSGEYEEALGKVDAAFGTTENHEALLSAPSDILLSDLNHEKCRIYDKWGKKEEALDACDHAINLNPGNMQIYFKKSQIFENAEELEKALRELKHINQHDPHFTEIDKKIERLEKIIKQKKNRNYWKILGLKRNANKKEIKSAYKKLAIQYHPDRCGKESSATTEEWSKEKCEQEFINIADAKEVLTDPEMRKLYDQGVDPMDPESKQDHDRSRHPFGGGGFRHHHQGHGGGGQGFKFKFNF